MKIIMGTVWETVATEGQSYTAAAATKAIEDDKPRNRVDWDAVEPHYRAGIRSLKDMGVEYGVSDAAIVKHARKHGWSRNLLAKIQAKAEAKVSAALVSAEVSPEQALTDAMRVEVEAEVQARIHIAHRADISRGRALVARMWTELSDITDRPELATELGAALLGDGDGRRMQDLLDRVLSLPGRVSAVKGLSEAMKNLIALERQAWRMDADDTRGKGGYEDMLKEVHAALNA